VYSTVLHPPTPSWEILDLGIIIADASTRGPVLANSRTTTKNSSLYLPLQVRARPWWRAIRPWEGGGGPEAPQKHALGRMSKHYHTELDPSTIFFTHSKIRKQFSGCSKFVEVGLCS
jgi:hypothetical protein